MERGVDGGKRVEVTANRRAREDFNTYQRAYMQATRAIKSGRASAWPR